MALGMTALGETEHSIYACAEVVQSRDATLKESERVDHEDVPQHKRS